MDKEAMPIFMFVSGYTFECADLGGDGIKLTLFDPKEYAAINLPTDQCEKLIKWLKHRRRESKQQEIPPPTVNNPVNKLRKKEAIWKKATAEVETLIDIIEVDLGITKGDIRNWACKKPNCVFARDVISFVIRARYELSTTEIAAMTGAKSHASVVISCRKFRTEGINRKFYSQRNLTSIYEGMKRRYKRVRLLRKL